LGERLLWTQLIAALEADYHQVILAMQADITAIYMAIRYPRTRTMRKINSVHRAIDDGAMLWI